MRTVDSSGFIFGELDSLPGCTAVCVSHAVFGAKHRPKGLGSSAHKERIRLMRSLGYEYALCTVNMANEVQRHILDSNGWKQLDTFENDKTGNYVGLFGKNLSEENYIASRV